MRRALPGPLLATLLLIALPALAGCGDDAAPVASPSNDASPGYSAEVRDNFLTSCVDNARTTANGAASEEQLQSTCECILGKVETELSEKEFAQFEQRLLGGTASKQESDQLTQWSTDCATAAGS